jgi:hypothetical protein
MTLFKNSFFTRLRRYGMGAFLTGSALLLTACAVSSAASKDSANVVRYQHRSEFGFVRIEHIESGAPDNAHPYTISADAMTKAMAKLKIKGAIGSDNKPLFAEEELAEIASPLAAALSSATAKEDVTFAVPGRHGWLGKYSGKTVTTGRVFVRDGKLHIIFGLIHDPFELESWENDRLPPFTPGSRHTRLEHTVTVAPVNVRMSEKRPEWVALDLTAGDAVPTAETSPASVEKSTASNPTDSAVDARYKEVKRQLEVLDRLKADGTITEKEYGERRRAILQGI